jgi:hypothetical protein
MAALATIRRFMWLGGVVLGLVFIAAGAYMVSEGLSAKNQVRDTLVAERITTSEDASIAKAPVDDAATAQAQSDVIKKHVMETTEGKTYSELDREDPLRATYLNSVSLRTALGLAVMGFRLSDLVVGLGAFIIVVGATNVLLTAPLLYWLREGEAAPAAERKRKVVGPAAPFPTG